MPRALITGMSGQDGSYLAEYLLSEGFEVHGLIRRTSGPFPWRLASVRGAISLHAGDVTDLASLISVIRVVKPDHLYNLAAQSSVPESFRAPVATMQITGVGALHVLEAVRLVAPGCRVYQAGSSEMFGNAAVDGGGCQNEDTPFHPASPYAVAKVQAHFSARLYREAWGMFIAGGILFNHESPRRGEEFVTRKIARGVAEISMGRSSLLRLGNLEARRDWGWAPDYVRAMVGMLRLDSPDDFVVATGVSHSVLDFARGCFARINRAWEDYIVVDPDLLRPKDVMALRGDASRARKILGWGATVDFEGLLDRMMEAELERVRCER